MLASPSVTIAIPTLNEEAHIERVIRGFLATRYRRLEHIVVADGGSSDATTTIVQRIANEDPRVSLLHNPLRVQSAGLNEILTRCESDLFLRIDAHCYYAHDYVEQSVAAATATDALNAGGAQRFVAETPFQAFVGVAANSRVGSGRPKYRDPKFTGFADTVFIGCYKTDVLQSLGGFRSDAAPNEDSELNVRLRAVRNNAVYISEKVKAWYLPRTNVRALARQYFRYGVARRQTIQLHGISKNPVRASLPLFGIVTVPLVAIAAASQGTKVLQIGVGLAASALLMDSASATKRFLSSSENFWRGVEGREPSITSLVVGGAFASVVMAGSHGVGQIRSVFRSDSPLRRGYASMSK